MDPIGELRTLTQALYSAGGLLPHVTQLETLPSPSSWGPNMSDPHHNWEIIFCLLLRTENMWETNRTGSLHIISQANPLSDSGSDSGTGMPLMASMKPPPLAGDGMPPCTQNICTQCSTNNKPISKWIHKFYTSMHYHGQKYYIINM